jgi:low affinity Fe/Cu permease
MGFGMDKDLPGRFVRRNLGYVRSGVTSPELDRSRKRQRSVLMPSDVSSRVGVFDRFARATSNIVARAAYFTFCVVLVIVWLPSIFLFRSVDTWQLVINTVTTIITFLMVALLQNSATRSDQAVQHKLNAIAAALAELMSQEESDLHEVVTNLRDAVGLETHESTSHNAGNSR